MSFQIRDWLTLEEEMLRQQAVVVGDVEDILQVLDKQKVRHSIDVLGHEVLIITDVLKIKVIINGRRSENFVTSIIEAIRSHLKYKVVQI